MQLFLIGLVLTVRYHHHPSAARWTGICARSRVYYQTGHQQNLFTDRVSNAKSCVDAKYCSSVDDQWTTLTAGMDDHSSCSNSNSHDVLTSPIATNHKASQRRMQRQWQCIRAVEAFYHDHQEEPVLRGSRMNGAESKLAVFINDCRRRKRSHDLASELVQSIEKAWPWFSWDSLVIQRHRQMVEDIASFYEVCHEEPKQRGSRGNGTESRLSLYINNRRVEKNKGSMDRQVRALIEDMWPWFDWESPVTKQHRRRLEDVQRFYSEFQEEPRNGGIRWNGTENKLADYIGNRRQEKKGDRLDAQMQASIETAWPWFDWASPHLTHHQQRIHEVHLFYDEFCEEPRIGGNRGKINGSEDRLAMYISSRRYEHNLGTLDPSIQALIEQTWIWFSWESPMLQQHRQRIDEISLFYWVYREEPRPNGTRWNGTEYVLGNYLSNRRSERRAGQVSLVVTQLLEEMCPWFNWERREVARAYSYHHRDDSLFVGLDGSERITIVPSKKDSFQYLDKRSIFIYNKIRTHHIACERLRRDLKP